MGLPRNLRGDKRQGVTMSLKKMWKTYGRHAAHRFTTVKTYLKKKSNIGSMWQEVRSLPQKSKKLKSSCHTKEKTVGNLLLQPAKADREMWGGLLPLGKPAPEAGPGKSLANPLPWLYRQRGRPGRVCTVALAPWLPRPQPEGAQYRRLGSLPSSPVEARKGRAPAGRFDGFPCIEGVLGALGLRNLQVLVL